MNSIILDQDNFTDQLDAYDDREGSLDLALLFAAKGVALNGTSRSDLDNKAPFPFQELDTSESATYRNPNIEAVFSRVQRSGLNANSPPENENAPQYPKTIDSTDLQSFDVLSPSSQPGLGTISLSGSANDQREHVPVDPPDEEWDGWVILQARGAK